MRRRTHADIEILLSAIFALLTLSYMPRTYAAILNPDPSCVAEGAATDGDIAQATCSQSGDLLVSESQNTAPGQAPSTSQTSSETSSSSDVTKTEAEVKKVVKDKSVRVGSIVAAPLPIVSPAIGSGIIPVVGYIFPFRKADKISPPSTIGAAGLITNNGSSGFGVGGNLFMKENTYQVTSIYVQGNLDYNLYGVGTAAGNEGLKLPLDQDGHAFFVEGLRRLKWRFFLGPRFLTGSSIVTVRPTSNPTPALPPDLALHTTLRSLGVQLNRDSRPNHFYPTDGMFLTFTSDFFSKSLGSKYSFQSYRFTFNKYWSPDKNQVLAYNVYVCGTGGEPPFYGNCIYGTNNELRGYEAGRYLDRHMYATQLEYRVSLPKRFGLAAFGGVGEVVPGGSQIFRINNFLPSLGGGPRYQLSKKYHLNLRADFARGKDSWTWSMGVGEAF
jgi:hypothetical protein